MAPQNSTLIQPSGNSSPLCYDATVAATTSSDIASDLSRISPILPGKNTHPSNRRPWPGLADQPDNEAEVDTVEIPIWICGEPRFVSGVTGQTTCNNIIEALIEDEVENLGPNYCEGAVSRDLRDYVITERWGVLEQPLPGDTFILNLYRAWGTKCATNEVKFKLRVNKRTCATSSSTIPEPTKMGVQRNAGATNTITTASTVDTVTVGAASTTTITEAIITTEDDEHDKLPKHHHRKSERITIINKMMRKILKQGQTIKEHLAELTENQAEIQRIEKLCKKVRQTKNGKKILMEHFFNSAALVAGTTSITSEDERFYQDPEPIFPPADSAAASCVNGEDGEKEFAAKPPDLETDDELFLVIENNDDLDSGVHFGGNKMPTSNLSELQPICSSIEMTEVLLETPKRKRRAHRNFESLRRHSLNAHAAVQKTTTTRACVEPRPDSNPEYRNSLQFDTIRREIIVKMNDLKTLLEREDNLVHNLELKCLQYKRENEIYGQQIGIVLKVDEIQGNLNRYAKEIVETELELYKTKLEIRESYLVLEDLKEMLSEKDPISGFGKSEFNRLLEKKFQLQDNKENNAQSTFAKQLNTIASPFVDNVYEFCDNNNSIIV